jgi:hypothetical protein
MIRHCEEAKPTKQSRIRGAGSGLLRCARNDVCGSPYQQIAILGSSPDGAERDPGQRCQTARSVVADNLFKIAYMGA